MERELAIERLAYICLGMLIATVGAWIVVLIDGIITATEVAAITAIYGAWIGLILKAIHFLARKAKE